MKNFNDLTIEKQVKKRIIDKLSEVIDKSNFIFGENDKTFEKKFAKYIGSKYALGVGNGTDAIRLCLRALGVGPGDKVLTVSFTSPFTIIAICQEGAVPIFCDIDDFTWTIDLKDAALKVDRQAKAIIPVHIFGNPCNMDKVLKFANKHKLAVIEDACQAHGAVINNKRVGNFSDAAAFSFYPTKNLGAMGDAGAIVTNNFKTDELMRILRNGGQTKRFWHQYLGINSRLDEMQAAILEIKLGFLDKDNKKRKMLAARYVKAFSNLPIRFQGSFANAQSCFHLFCIRVDNRNNLASYLSKNNIPNDIYYPYPVHLQKAFRNFNKGKLKVTELVSSEILALPLYPSLTLDNQDKIIKTINHFFNRKAKSIR